MEKKIIKVCGMRDGENIRQVARLGVDWIGMVFVPDSPRFVQMTPSHAGIIPDRAEGVAQKVGFKRVGVFKDDMMQNVVTRVVNFKLDIVQLHGDEEATYVDNLRRTLQPDIQPDIKIMKAINIASADDLQQAEEYEGKVDFFLFDTKSEQGGGSGRQFDWSVLADYHGATPFLLSGGIGPDDAERVGQFQHPKCIGIDVNSRFESEPGVKDVELLRKFIQKLKA